MEENDNAYFEKIEQLKKLFYSESCEIFYGNVKKNEHWKIVQKAEIESYLMVHDLRCSIPDITPKIINICSIQTTSCFALITERYSHTLEDLMSIDKNKSLIVLEKAKHLIKKLHERKILHTDVWATNIVYDETTNRVSLIDFDGSTNIEKLLENVSSNIDIMNPVTSFDKEYMKFAEYEEWNHPNVNFKFTSKDTWLFDLEFNNFNYIEKRINSMVI